MASSGNEGPQSASDRVQDSARHHDGTNAKLRTSANGKRSPSKSLSTAKSETSMAPSEDEDTYMARLVAGDQQAEAKEQVLGPRRPRARKTRWTQRSVKLLVIGDSGLGKTTLVRCLLAVPGEPITLHDGSSTDFKQFNRDPDVYLSTVEWDDEEDHVHWTYQVQDTPGYGDDLDLHTNIARVQRYIEAQNQRWHKLERAPRRGGALADATDPRVDLCLFCLPPHRLRNIDVQFMHQVSKLVPILPVVMKADTMLMKECINYRKEVSQRMKDPSAPITMFEFSPSTLEACGITDSAMSAVAAARPPYLVVCSNTLSEERLRGGEPEFWPERRYMWGTSQGMNPEHSDLLLLRRLLLTEGVEEIATSKISRYEAWRTRQMKQFKPMRKLLSAGVTTIITLGTVLGITYAVKPEVVRKLGKKVDQGGQKAKEKLNEAVTPVMERAEESVAAATAELPADSALRKVPGVPSEPPRKKFLGIF